MYKKLQGLPSAKVNESESKPIQYKIGKQIVYLFKGKTYTEKEAKAKGIIK